MFWLRNKKSNFYLEACGRVLDSRLKGRGFQPRQCHCVVSLSKNINPSLVLVQPRKIRPYITERLLMRRKESNQTNKIKQNRIDPDLLTSSSPFENFVNPDQLVFDEARS